MKMMMMISSFFQRCQFPIRIWRRQNKRLRFFVCHLELFDEVLLVEEEAAMHELEKELLHDDDKANMMTRSRFHSDVFCAVVFRAFKKKYPTHH